MTQSEHAVRRAWQSSGTRSRHGSDEEGNEHAPEPEGAKQLGGDPADVEHGGVREQDVARRDETSIRGSRVARGAAWGIKLPKSCPFCQRSTAPRRDEMPSRKPGQFIWHMKPQHRGSFTQWRLSGSVPTVVPGGQIRQVIRTLWFWSGWPVELVLPVAVETAPWFEWWTGAVATIPEEELRVRFVVRHSGLRREKNRHG